MVIKILFLTIMSDSTMKTLQDKTQTIFILTIEEKKSLLSDNHPSFEDNLSIQSKLFSNHQCYWIFFMSIFFFFM